MRKKVSFSRRDSAPNYAPVEEVQPSARASSPVIATRAAAAASPVVGERVINDNGKRVEERRRGSKSSSGPGGPGGSSGSFSGGGGSYIPFDDVTFPIVHDRPVDPVTAAVYDGWDRRGLHGFFAAVTGPLLAKQEMRDHHPIGLLEVDLIGAHAL